jgi:hypothetical protein
MQQMSQCFRTSLNKQMHVSAIGLGKNALQVSSLQPGQGLAQRVFALARSQRAKLPAAVRNFGVLHQSLNITARSFTSSELRMTASSGSPVQQRPPSNQATPGATFVAPIVRRINSIPGKTLLNFLLGLSMVVCLAWMFSAESSRGWKDSRVYTFMTRNFLCEKPSSSIGRLWTDLVTNYISHETTFNYTFNYTFTMLSLFFIGAQVICILGNSTFLGLYFGAGIASDFFTACWMRYWKESHLQ